MSTKTPRVIGPSALQEAAARLELLTGLPGVPRVQAARVTPQRADDRRRGARRLRA